MGKKLTVFETPTGRLKLSAKGLKALDGLCAAAGNIEVAAKYTD